MGFGEPTCSGPKYPLGFEGLFGVDGPSDQAQEQWVSLGNIVYEKVLEIRIDTD